MLRLLWMSLLVWRVSGLRCYGSLATAPIDKKLRQTMDNIVDCEGVAFCYKERMKAREANSEGVVTVMQTFIRETRVCGTRNYCRTEGCSLTASLLGTDQCCCKKDLCNSATNSFIFFYFLLAIIHLFP